MSVQPNRWYGHTFQHGMQLVNGTRVLPRFVLKRLKRKRAAFLRSVISQGGVGAEIGVQRGLLTHVLLHVLRPSKIHLIDPWYKLGREWPWAIGNRSTTQALANLMREFEDELSSGAMDIHVGFDLDVLPAFPENYFDWVYLDTSHTYEDTCKELQLLKRTVKADGIIAGDNCESDPRHAFHGVYRAVEEFVSTQGYEHVPTSCRAPSQFAIRRTTATE